MTKGDESHGAGTDSTTTADTGAEDPLRAFSTAATAANTEVPSAQP
jgi:hypothetical protein